jgi:hypothetical protein
MKMPVCLKPVLKNAGTNRLDCMTPFYRLRIISGSLIFSEYGNKFLVSMFEQVFREPLVD